MSMPCLLSEESRRGSEGDENNAKAECGLPSTMLRRGARNEKKPNDGVSWGISLTVNAVIELKSFSVKIPSHFDHF